MIWSIVPEEVIFPGKMPAATERVLVHCGRQVVVRGGRIERLLSTDPADFLDNRFSPGALLNRKPY